MTDCTGRDTLAVGHGFAGESQKGIRHMLALGHGLVGEGKRGMPEVGAV